MDTTKVENQIIPIVEMSIQDIYSHYNIPNDSSSTKSLKEIMLRDTYTKYKRELTETNKTCKYYTDLMIKKRDEIIKSRRKKNDLNEENLPKMKE